MSDRIAVMSFGKVMQLGPSVEIYERPANRFVAGFIGESNFLDGCVNSIRGDQAVVAVPAWGCEITGMRANSVKAGDDVSISVRPEKIRLSDAEEPGPNCFEGSVADSTYIGSDTHVLVDVRGRKIKVWEQNSMSTLDPNAYYRKGDRVWLTLLPENTLVLPNA